jgi:transposase
VVRASLKDPPGWKKRVGYGQRWRAETFFSGFKRLFGEAVSAKRFERRVGEIKLKVWVYNLMLSLVLAPALALAAAGT